MGTYLRKEADVVVVGSGPGGATVAMELSAAGRDVILLERGRDHRGKWYYGTHLGCMIYCEKAGFLMTEEGLNIICGIMTGGSTNLFCGCASPPPNWLKTKYKINLDSLVKETIAELGIEPLPQSLWGEATTRIYEAAGELGYAWEPQPKFMNTGRTRLFDCGAKCMLGCRCGAKWTANEYIDKAVRSGCRLITGAKVQEVLVNQGCAEGVVASLGAGRQVLRVEAQTVIVAAGGIGTPVILQHSGIPEAGQGIAMDTTVMVYGTSRDVGMAHDPPMAVSWCDDEHGYMLSTLIDPWMMYPFVLVRKGIYDPWRLKDYTRALGVMIKLKDEISGGISMEGRIRKPMTERDSNRLNHAANLCRKILLRAGCGPDSIFISPLRGTHPSGTVRIGDLLGTQLQTKIKNLYVCDASCFPEALDRPTVLTIISLGKRLARYLLNKGKKNAKEAPAAKDE